MHGCTALLVETAVLRVQGVSKTPTQHVSSRFRVAKTGTQPGGAPSGPRPTKASAAWTSPEHEQVGSL